MPAAAMFCGSCGTEQEPINVVSSARPVSRERPGATPAVSRAGAPHSPPSRRARPPAHDSYDVPPPRPPTPRSRDEPSPSRAPVSAPPPAHRPPPAPHARVALPPPAAQGPVSGRLYASFGQRVGASLIDGVISALIGGVLGVIAIAIVAALLSSAETTPDSALVVLITSYVLLPVIAYVVALAFLFWQLRRRGEKNGQTFGKQTVDIRIVRADGRPVNAGTVFMRHVLMGMLCWALLIAGVYTVGSAVVVVILLIVPADLLWPLWDERRQALHDKLAHTFVVVADGVVAPSQAAVAPIAPPTARSRYDPDDY